MYIKNQMQIKVVVVVVVVVVVHAIETSRKTHDLKQCAREVYLSNVLATRPGIFICRSCGASSALYAVCARAKVWELAPSPAIQH